MKVCADVFVSVGASVLSEWGGLLTRSSGGTRREGPFGCTRMCVCVSSDCCSPDDLIFT